MKLSEEVLVEIIDIVRQGIAEGKDISELLRAMDLVVTFGENKIGLSLEYLRTKGR